MTIIATIIIIIIIIVIIIIINLCESTLFCDRSTTTLCGLTLGVICFSFTSCDYDVDDDDDDVDDNDDDDDDDGGDDDYDDDPCRIGST